MATFQISAGTLAKRWGSKIVLFIGTIVAALGYWIVGSAHGTVLAFIGLAIAGLGSSTQHPLASGAVTRVYGKNARGPLGIYNFCGDLGKASIPALLSLMLTIWSWQHSLRLLSLLGIVVAVILILGLPNFKNIDKVKKSSSHTEGHHTLAASKTGFRMLMGIGMLDTATRMGFLTFLPFILKAKGAGLPTVGLGLSLVFIGGALGKFTCGWLGERFGLLKTVVITEGGTAAAIALVLALPLWLGFCVLPLLGIMLNGTSSVLYGTVPELATDDNTEKAFAMFYTAVIGSGAVAPIFYGVLSDVTSPMYGTIASAVTALATIPLAFRLAPSLAKNNHYT